MELTKSMLRNMRAIAQERMAEGTSIPDWYEGRISVYDFLLNNFDLPEGD